MFFSTSVASIETPVGVLELRGDSSTKLTKIAVDNFGFMLAAPYRDSKFYRFGLKLSPEINPTQLDPDTTLSDLIDSFEQLLQLPDVVRRYGKLTYCGTTTRRYVKSKLSLMLFNLDTRVPRASAAMA